MPYWQTQFSTGFRDGNIGRRLGLIASTLVFVFGVTLQTAATAIPLFTAGRFFAGFGVGLISALSNSSATHPS
jgi:MFS family permease